MRKTIIYIFPAFLLIALLVSCNKEPQNVPFGVNVNNITVGPEGSNEIVRINSSESWVASTTVPWITISPMNGNGSTDCNIIIDSTLLADNPREAVVHFTSGPDVSDIKVVQTGYEKMITLSLVEKSLPAYGNYGERYFEVDVTTNVPFKVNVPASWVNISKYDLSLEKGYRPRTITLKVNWDPNTRPNEREALLSFDPTDGSTLARQDALKIVQDSAEAIADNRQGDSLAIVSSARSLNFSMYDYDGKKMDDWSFITIWEPTDKGYTEDKKGRVKSVSFKYVNTKEGLPYEVQFLTKCESFTIFSNSNSFLREFVIGEYICELPLLKSLSLNAFGVIDLSPELAKLKSLEELSLQSNNLREFPEILTPENFPNLTYIDMAANRAKYFYDMSDMIYDINEIGGLVGDFPKRVLEWDNLKFLRLSYNYITGEVPDMLDYEKVYTEAEVMACDTLPNGHNNPAGYNLIGKPKVLPNIEVFCINLNLMTGAIPEWILYHPKMMEWDPFTLVFNQEAEVLNEKGVRAGFNNVPETPNYYYDAYPLLKPDNYDEDEL